MSIAPTTYGLPATESRTSAPVPVAEGQTLTLQLRIVTGSGRRGEPMAGQLLLRDAIVPMQDALRVRVPSTVGPEMTITF